MERLHFSRTILQKELQFHVDQIDFIFAQPGRKVFEVVFATFHLFEQCIERFELKKRSDPRFEYVSLTPLSERDRKNVTVIMLSENIVLQDIETWLSRYCTVNKGVDLKDEDGIRTGARRFDVKLRREENNGSMQLQHVPSIIQLGPVRGHVFYQGQAKDCRRCGSLSHLAAECDITFCKNCNSSSHETRDCEQPLRCNLCRENTHTFRNCPHSYANRTAHPAPAQERRQTDRALQDQQEDESQGASTPRTTADQQEDAPQGASTPRTTADQQDEPQDASAPTTRGDQQEDEPQDASTPMTRADQQKDEPQDASTSTADRDITPADMGETEVEVEKDTERPPPKVQQGPSKKKKKKRGRAQQETPDARPPEETMKQREEEAPTAAAVVSEDTTTNAEGQTLTKEATAPEDAATNPLVVKIPGEVSNTKAAAAADRVPPTWRSLAPRVKGEKRERSSEEEGVTGCAEKILRIGDTPLDRRDYLHQFTPLEDWMPEGELIWYTSDGETFYGTQKQKTVEGWKTMARKAKIDAFWCQMKPQTNFYWGPRLTGWAIMERDLRTGERVWLIQEVVKKGNYLEIMSKMESESDLDPNTSQEVSGTISEKGSREISIISIDS